MEGWIKLHRRIENWEWYKHHPTLIVFIHLLIHANHEDRRWRGIDVPKGHLITGINNLSKDLSLSFRSIRTALKHLKSTSEITIQTTNRYSLIKLNNWDEYQTNDKQSDKQATSQRQATDYKQEGKNVKNEKKNSIYTSDFDEFWNAYPRKIAKRKVFSIWKRRGLSKYLPKMLMFIGKAIKTKQWLDGYIPHPTTFLNGDRWEDDLASYGEKREAASFK